MKQEFVDLWLKTGIIRPRQRDAEKISSLINSAAINAKVAMAIPLSDDSASLVFRELYESVRQLGEARWLLIGYEPTNHEISIEALKDLDITEKVRLNYLDRFKKTRHDISYRGFRASIQQAQEMIDFWNKCGKEIVKLLKAGL